MTPEELAAIRADLDRRVPALDLRDHCRALLAALDEARAEADTWHKRWQQLMREHEKDQAVVWAVKEVLAKWQRTQEHNRQVMAAGGGLFKSIDCTGDLERALGETP